MPTLKRAYRYRCYPTLEQAAELARTFGCVRLVYNRALEVRTVAWHQQQRRISYVETSALLTRWKRTSDLAFLNEVSSVPLQQTLRHLQAGSSPSGPVAPVTRGLRARGTAGTRPNTPAAGSATATSSSR